MAPPTPVALTATGTDNNDISVNSVVVREWAAASFCGEEGKIWDGSLAKWVTECLKWPGKIQKPLSSKIIFSFWNIPSS